MAQLRQGRILWHDLRSEKEYQQGIILIQCKYRRSDGTRIELNHQVLRRISGRKRQKVAGRLRQMHTKILVRKPQRRVNLGYLDVYGRTKTN